MKTHAQMLADAIENVAHMNGVSSLVLIDSILSALYRENPEGYLFRKLDEAYKDQIVANR
jgi:hypothetical protein